MHSDRSCWMVLDKLGKEIKEGCYIIYGHALGRSAGLAFGKVISVSTGEKKYYNGGSYTVYKIKIRGVDDDWKVPKLLSRDSILQYPDRIVVIDNPPEKYTKLYS